MKKLFGEINLTWPKVIILAIAIGIYTAIMAMLPLTAHTSFSDLAVSFEVWIFMGIFIIMNSKSPKDSALKCFIFFLISQPIIYLLQDVINGSHLFKTYYKYWFIWTIGCLPMGYIGNYMKKDKWWGLLILLPMLLLLGKELSGYLSQTMFSFPRHLLTVLFCISTLIIYPLVIFNNKKIKITGVIISILIIIIMVIICILKPPIYETDILLSREKYQFDDTYKVSLDNSKYGDLEIIYNDGIECYIVHAKFKKAGKATFILESPEGNKQLFDLVINMILIV
jgi:hypothetical protein